MLFSACCGVLKLECLNVIVVWCGFALAHNHTAIDRQDLARNVGGFI